mmetsp:Transcript_2482/g.5681  ORF Transcript_2482/g.5681 Transcript_2482/m.5681 type:complete len:126 (-) Transcript_2482:657-1034(-)
MEHTKQWRRALKAVQWIPLVLEKMTMWFLRRWKPFRRALRWWKQSILRMICSPFDYFEPKLIFQKEGVYYVPYLFCLPLLEQLAHLTLLEGPRLFRSGNRGESFERNFSTLTTSFLHWRAVVAEK